MNSKYEYGGKYVSVIVKIIRDCLFNKKMYNKNVVNDYIKKAVTEHNELKTKIERLEEDVRRSRMEIKKVREDRNKIERMKTTVGEVRKGIEIQEIEHVLESDKCINCGGDKGIHHYTTLQCPVGGHEASLYNIQEYQDTVFNDGVSLEILIKENAELKDQLRNQSAIRNQRDSANSDIKQLEVQVQTYREEIDELKTDIELLEIELKEVRKECKANSKSYHKWNSNAIILKNKLTECIEALKHFKKDCKFDHRKGLAIISILTYEKLEKALDRAEKTEDIKE